MFLVLYNSIRHAVAFSSKVFEFVRTLNTFEVAGEL